MPKRSRLLSWWDSLSSLSRFLAIALAAPMTVLNVWALATIFSYFESLAVVLLVAALLSFILNYAVTWLEVNGIRRAQAAILVFLGALVLLSVAGVTLLPLAIGQAQQLVTRLPEWFDSGQRQLMMLDGRIEALGLPISLDGVIPQVSDRLKSQLQIIAGQALNLSLNLAVFTVAKLLDVVLIAISTLYLLQHGQDVWTSLVEWLPTKVQQPFSRTLRSSFQNYFLGQIISGYLHGRGADFGVFAAAGAVWPTVWPDNWADGADSVWWQRWDYFDYAAGGAPGYRAGASGAGCGADCAANC